MRENTVKSPVAENAKKPFFDKQEISRPSQSDHYAWCDFIEIKCMLNEDARFSRGQLLEILDDSALLYGEVTDSDDKLLNASVPQDTDEDLEDEEVLQSEQEIVNPRSSAKNDIKVNAWFSSILFRASIFGENYPFYLSDDKQEIFFKKTLSSNHKFYIQLLVSSSLRLVPKERWPDLTESFEILSEKIFSALMPNGWNVHRFGAKGSSRYKGLLYDKLTALAKDIRAQFTAPPHYYKKGNSGDGGLDLVAWHPLGDERIGIPVALAQCGCVADEFTMKTLEASPSRLRANMRAPLPWMTYYFMPHDLVYNAGSYTDWQRGNDLTESIIIDRYRFVKLALQYNLFVEEGVMYPVIDELLQLSAH
jgi:hypothetical protein